jgi:hypothetical protein
LCAAQQMGEARLPELGMAALGAEAVGNPNARAMLAEQRADHVGTPAEMDNVQHAQSGDENPFPLRLLHHPHRSLVGRDHIRRGDRRGDGRDDRFQGGLRAGENVAECAFADLVFMDGSSAI